MKNNSMNAKTVAFDFNYVPTDDVKLLSVRPGVDPFWALSEAGCIDAAVRAILLGAVQEPLDGDIAWLCRFAMDAANAFRNAAGAAV